MKNTIPGEQGLTFEEAIKELEDIVLTLEEGTVSLEQSLELYKRGIILIEFCNKQLTEAQGVVSLLSRSRTGKLEEISIEVPEKDEN